jgi:hypothetical protein
MRKIAFQPSVINRSKIGGSRRYGKKLAKRVMNHLDEK